ncbi:MAG: hypothetical protein JRF25_00520 [Deltaproteobacteria bacterium]|nr:hypothetical protein [Deltaproteobacteria bacterium]
MFKRILGLFFILLFVGGGMFLWVKTDAPLKNDDIIDNSYKCFAEMFSEEAKILGSPKLGEIVRDETGQYRVMVECKHFEAPLWVQFVDVAVDGKFDNNCDFAIYIEIRDGVPLAAMNTCMKAVEDVAKYCLMNDIEIKDFMHRAPKIYVELEQVI